ncbi:MAG: hypothetical protein MZW92_79340 [Comamonadaceae bacterium]|nr:hypothetical protein [Comamonadaceae bacterium]
MFLIDRRGVVREIYTTAFLLPEVMLNDIKTLVLEEEEKSRDGRAAEAPRGCRAPSSPCWRQR